MVKKVAVGLLMSVLGTSCFITPPSPPTPPEPKSRYNNIGFIELSRDDNDLSFGSAVFRKLATPAEQDKLNPVKVDTCKVFAPGLEDPTFDGVNLNVGDEVRIDSIGSSGSPEKLTSLRFGVLADYVYSNDLPFSLPAGGVTATIKGNNVIEGRQNLAFPVTPRPVRSFSPSYIQIMTPDYKIIGDIQPFYWIPTQSESIVSIYGRTAVANQGDRSVSFECQAKDDGNFTLPRDIADIFIRLGYFDIEVLTVARKNYLYTASRDTLIYTITAAPSAVATSGK